MKKELLAVAIGPKVFLGSADGELIAEFCPMSDDYAFTNAREYADRYNYEVAERIRQEVVR